MSVEFRKAPNIVLSTDEVTSIERVFIAYIGLYS